MSVTPKWSYCIIAREPLQGKGIYVPPEIAKRNAPTSGFLSAAGEGCEDWVKSAVGKMIHFKNLAGDWKKVGDKDIFFIEEKDILAVED